MTCEELSLEYGSYALGIAMDPERGEISEHLSRRCPQCTAGVKDAMAAVTSLSSAVKMAEPPARLRRRIVSMVTPENAAPEKKAWLPAWLPWSVAGALAIVLVSIVLPSRLHPPVRQTRLEEALGILNDPLAKDVTFGVPAARGRVFVSPSKGVVLIAAQLPALDAGKTFELWVIPATGGNPIPSGLFRGNDDSSAIFVRPGPADRIAAVAVSVEPEGGSPQPTTTPFIVTKL